MFCYFTESEELRETGKDDGALHKAAEKNLLFAAKWLINNGANLEARASGGLTPLHVAASDSSMLVARELVNRGANKEALDNTGRRPIDLAKSSEIKALLGRRK